MSGRKKIIGMIVVTLLMAGLSLLAERQEVTQNYSLERNPSGEGDYETEMTLVVEGIGEIPYTVTVPEQKLTPQQEKELIAAAKKELAEEFPGDNESMNVIRGAVRIRDSYQNGQVTAAWSFDDGVVDDDGTIVVADIPKEGQLVQASVELQCGETMEWEEFYFRIYKAAQSEKEALLEDLGQKLAEQQEARGSASIELPEKLGQYHLEWNRKKSYTAVEILFLGIVATVLVPAAERSRRREQEKKRQSRMELEYPDIVSKMALLLGAGMTPLGAWKKIAASYEAKRKKKQVPVMPAYEEMLITCHEIESGVGEQRAYEAFGKRCKMGCYRKFANILAQNLRKGGGGLVSLLETEAENSFMERKRMAKRYGEEAGTKILAPMMLMLGIVIVILIVPAVITFQM